jgi:hypothetical protein
MDTLQNIRQYLVVTVCLLAAVPMLFCLGSWFCTSPRRRSLYTTLNRQFRALPPGGKLLAVVFLATFIAMGSTKTNNAPPPSPPPGGIVFDDGLQMEPDGEGFLSEGFWGPRLTTNQYLAGFALVCVATNAAPFSLIPTNALAESYWTRYGVAEDTFWLPATNWSFTLGTNAVEGLHVSSSGTLSFGGPKGSPRAREMPDSSELDFLAPLQTAIGIAPPVGRFWHAPTSSNSLLLTWQDVSINRDTNYPVTFQSELFRNGDFTFRYAFTNSHTPTLPHALTNFVVGAQNNGGGETYAFSDTNRLVNGLELRWRAFGLLDPGIDDHDGDGLSTYDEVMVHGSDPRLTDTDFDGRSDPDELTGGTAPCNPDSDGDGLADSIDPQPLAWNDPNADADNDGYPLWEELLYGTSDTVPGDVAQLLANGSRQVTFTIVGTPSPGTMLAINGRPLLLAGRTAFSLALPNGSFTLLALDNAPNAAVRTTSPDCIVLLDRTGGLAPGATGTGTATLVLPVLSIGSGGSICLHEANQMITANVTAGLPGYYDWQWNGGSHYGGTVISSSGIQPDWIAVQFWPDNGNGNCCVASEGLSQCRRIYCNHGLLAWECGICTGGSGEAWCGLHDDWKCRCACLTLVGGGMLAPGGETVCMIGAASDSCVNHVHYDPCCDCFEHLGWSWAEDKTNIVRHVSTRLDVRLDGVSVAVGKKLVGATQFTVGGEQLSETFGDARIIASHELHPSDTVTSAWTVASIGLEPATYAEGRFLIRGGTGCVSYVTVVTDSALTEGSLRLYAGATGLLFSETEDEALVDAHALCTNTPPDSVGAYRDFWLGTAAGGSHTLNYSLRTPQGAVCLGNNLAIEAIVTKFATNVYYAAYGATSGIVVALSPASYDPAGYTLRLNGSVCATGQPPWLIAVSNLTAGVHTLTVQSETFPDLADEALLYVITVDINGDYNRDENPADHVDEADAVTFVGPKGMVIIANTDDDVNDQTEQPDCGDNVINGANDLVDIYMLKLAKLGIAAGDVPSGMTLELSVENPSGEPAGAPAAKDRVRIFRSKVQDAQGVVGPDPLTDKVVFKKSPGASDMDIDLLGGTGYLEVGIEGIEYGRQVIVKLVTKLTGQELCTDSVRLIVSPFLVLANTDKATKAYVSSGPDFEEGPDWVDFYNDTAAALDGVVQVVEYGSTEFMQDYGEIGASRSAPGQTERKLCTVAGFFGDRFADQVDTDTGYFHIEAGNPGGNVEASPPIQGYSYGRLIVGSTLQSNIKAFMQAQRIQTDNGNMIELPVGWLQVGHVDEVMTIVPVGSGFRVLVADLQLAIDLLRNNPNEETWGGFDMRAQILAAYDDPNNAAKIALITNNLASIRTNLAQGLGINTLDLIKVPVAFKMDAGGPSETKLPNMVNMIVVKPQSGALNLVVPRTYFVPFATNLGSSLTSAGCSGTVTFVDTRAPHGAGGEAHCAGNVRRELP